MRFPVESPDLPDLVQYAALQQIPQLRIFYLISGGYSSGTKVIYPT